MKTAHRKRSNPAQGFRNGGLTPPPPSTPVLNGANTRSNNVIRWLWGLEQTRTSFANKSQVQLFFLIFQMSQKIAFLTIVLLVICTLLLPVATYRMPWKRQAQTVAQCEGCCDTCFHYCSTSDTTSGANFFDKCFYTLNTCKDACATNSDHCSTDCDDFS